MYGSTQPGIGLPGPIPSMPARPAGEHHAPPDSRNKATYVSYQATDKFVFPKWANYLLPLILVSALGGAAVVPPLVLFGGSAETQNVGYQPDQPVPYSHELHVGQLGIDCRYCHTSVDDASFAAIPPTQTCINCHAPGTTSDGGSTNLSGVRQNSLALRPVWESWETGLAIPWVKIHDLPDYAYFNHSAHVNRGVGCVTCHGRVDKMGGAGTDDAIAGVYQVQNLSMAWCLECHRAPENHLRPVDEITNFDWSPVMHPLAIEEGFTDADNPHHVSEAQQIVGMHLKDRYQINSAAYMQSCSTCHR